MKKMIFLLIIIFPYVVSAQKMKTVNIEGTAQVEFPDSQSKQAVEKIAVDKAIINALENEFGTGISGSSSAYIQNINSKTDKGFHMIANTLVNGDFIQLLDKRCEEVPGLKEGDGKKIPVKDYRCWVKIEAREWSKSQPTFEAYPLASEDIKSRTTAFNDGAQFFLYFKSASSGSLTIYLNVGKVCQRLLPYDNMAEKYEDGVPIKSDQEYFLFSEKNKYFDGDNKIGRYFLTADSEQDQNRFVVIFSRDRIAKPGLSEGNGKDNSARPDKLTGFIYPKQLSPGDFQGWLSRLMHDRNVSVKWIDITITK